MSKTATILETPDNMKNIWVTYKKTFYRGPYGTDVKVEVVTKRGFYSKLFDHISVPPNWEYFNGVLLPHGFGGDRLKMGNVISWKYTDDEE